MIPGLRFLCVATLLAISILVFGVGAAAFLRATHQQFATLSPWQAQPEVVFIGRAVSASGTDENLTGENLSARDAGVAPAKPSVNIASSSDKAASAPAETPASAQNITSAPAQA